MGLNFDGLPLPAMLREAALVWHGAGYELEALADRAGEVDGDELARLVRDIESRTNAALATIFGDHTPPEVSE